MKIEIDFIDKLAKILSDNALTEITIEDERQTISVKKEVHEIVSTAMPVAAAQVASAPVQAQKSETGSETPTKGKAIVSPMVGTFYSKPAPDKEPFVKVGDTVSSGDVVCIIEAMKLMNEIESEFSGRIVEICVEDGQAVEYGQTIMYVE